MRQMIHHGVSLYDDIEIIFRSSQSERRRLLDYARRWGITHIRGVPVGERWVYYSNTRDARSYARSFFQRHVKIDELLM